MIEAHLSGRLGNQLFQYATVRSVAEKRGFDFYIDPKRWDGHGIFSCSLGTKTGLIYHQYKDSELQDYNPAVFNILDGTRFIGFYQSYKYFTREDVLEWFSPIQQTDALPIMEQYNPDDCCFINIRGTDIIELMPHCILSLDYYKYAMERMLTINNTLKFVVVTDDPPFAERYFPSMPILSNSFETDFYLLYSAKYLICPISSFAWWAGYLQNDNIVIAPDRWFNHNTDLNYFCPRDINTDKFIWL